MKIQMRLFVIFLILLSGCGLETKTLHEFYGKDLNDVTKIEILDGSTGHKKNITDKIAINDFLREIKDIKFIPEENQEDRKGFRYSINLFQGEETTFSFSLNEINDNNYYTEPDIYPIIDSIYKKLNVQEK
ncbi:MAG: hypothetical protein K0S51_1202 [Bacillales bacterium]|jgi:hypothetical protein|nr:hypothetical protein [Bacillales bacterium]